MTMRSGGVELALIHSGRRILPMMQRQPAEFKASREGLLNAFPDIQVEVEDTAADGGHVVVRWRARGTHRGGGLGMPPTNRKVDFRGMTWLTFKNGVIIEGCDSWNLGRLLEVVEVSSVYSEY
jgi:steroid delta-isomerase-like uncharacterized protein